MKKIIIPIIIVLALSLGCTKNFEEINTSETTLTENVIQPQYVFEPVLYYIHGSSHQRNFDLFDYHYAHYTGELGIADVGRYEYRDDWGGVYWRNFYTSRLQEYWLIRKCCEREGESFNAFQAANDIWNVYAWTILVNRWGDVPYLDAEGNFNAGNGTVLPYTSQKDIYLDLLARLKADSDILANTSNQGMIDPAYDILYKGDYEKWRKFANTLIMRLSMRLSRTDCAETAKSYFVAAVPLAMDSPSDYARISCDSSTAGDYLDVTSCDWAEVRPDEYFMKLMNGNNPGYTTGVVDPRRAIWFHEGTDPVNPNPTTYYTDGSATNWDGFPDGTYTLGSVATVSSDHGGANSFALLNYADKNGFWWFNNHNTNNENLSFCIATYSETLFLRAEAALRGWYSGDAQTLYKQAIKASMDEVCYFITRSGGTVTISDAEFETYYAALPAFGTSKEAQFRSIMIQKWIALFPNAQEAWSEIRRTGYPEVGVVSYPILSPNAQVQDGNLIQRMSYPDNEYNYNGANIPADYQKGGSKYTYRGQFGLYWSQAGEGNTLSKDTQPNNF